MYKNNIKIEVSQQVMSKALPPTKTGSICIIPSPHRS